MASRYFYPLAQWPGRCFFVILYIFWFSDYQLQSHPVKSQAEEATKATAYELKYCVSLYVKEYGKAPPQELKELMSVLYGKNLSEANPRQIVFWAPKLKSENMLLLGKPSNWSETGDLLDGWGIPFRAEKSTNNNEWLLISSGKNRIYENGKSDDIVISFYPLFYAPEEVLLQIKLDIEAIIFTELRDSASKQKLIKEIGNYLDKIFKENPGAFEYSSEDLRNFRAGLCPFSDGEIAGLYARLKAIADGCPMPLLAEAYQKKFESGGLMPQQKIIFYKIMASIID